MEKDFKKVFKVIYKEQNIELGFLKLIYSLSNKDEIYTFILFNTIHKIKNPIVVIDGPENLMCCFIEGSRLMKNGKDYKVAKIIERFELNKEKFIEILNTNIKIDELKEEIEVKN